MDWTLAIDRNRAALLRVVAALFAMAGLADDIEAPALLLPRHLRNAVLRLLRPAESAARRLIVIAARGLTVRPRPTGNGFDAKAFGDNGGKAPRKPAFALFDARKAFPARPPVRRSRTVPRICVVGLTDPAPLRNDRFLMPQDPMDALHIACRLRALKGALDDISGQARRLVRRQAAPALPRKTARLSPLRPGHPPGHRRRPLHPVDWLLPECDALARHALEAPDSS